MRSAANSPISAEVKPVATIEPSASTFAPAPASLSAATNNSVIGVTTRTASSVALGRELTDARLGDQGAPADHDQSLCGQRHLVDQVARHEHRSSLGGQVTEEEAGPTYAFGVETVDGLVEEQNSRIPEKGGGDPEPLSHARASTSRLVGGPPR